MAVIQSGTNTAGVMNVDANFNGNVVTPTTNTQSGYMRQTYLADSTNAKDAQVTEDGEALVGHTRQVWEVSFNGQGATNWGTKMGTNATTMTKAVTNGFMRLNSGSGVAATTGISIYSTAVHHIFLDNETRIQFNIKPNNQAGTNKQMEWGLGYYNFAAGQANGMNEFIGFRVTPGGVLQGVLAYSTGGAPTETTVLINGGVPFTDAQTRVYELRISNTKIEYWAAGILQNTISMAVDVYAVVKAIAYPVICRVFNSGAASLAPILDVGKISVYRVGDINVPDHATTSALMDKGSHYFQPDLLTGAGTNPFNFPATGTTPTAATGSNTASVLNNVAQIGGLFAMNMASFLTTNNSNILVSSYTNPTVPTANGAGNNSRNLIITGMSVSPLVVTTLGGGGTGGFGGQYFAAVGHSATSLATADADGTTAVSQKAPRLIPHPHVFSFAVNPAAGTIETGAGDFFLPFPTPLVVHPGEVLACGVRELINPSVAHTSGVVQGSVYFNGYWD